MVAPTKATMGNITLKPTAHDRARASIRISGLTISGIALALCSDHIRIEWPSCILIEEDLQPELEAELTEAFGAWLDLAEGVS